MQSIFILAIALFHLFIAVASAPNISPNNPSLHVRRPDLCSCIPGCTGCTANCCPAGQNCVKSGGLILKFSVDSCCTGDTCAASFGPSSPSPPTSTSTSSTSQTTSSITTSADIPSTQTPELPITTSSSTPPPSTSSPGGGNNERRVGTIAGGTVAGAVGIGVVGGILIVVNLAHVKYLWGSLASALFGIFIFKSRRLIFSVDKDVPPTQISLFLTPYKSVSDFTSDRNLTTLVWKVFGIGYTQRQFDVAVPVKGALEGSTHQHVDQKIDLTIPSTYREGIPELGFGTVIDDGQLVKCEAFEVAPAILNEEREWISGSKANGRMRTATIHTNNIETRRIAVGTVDDADIHPFLLVERGAFKNSGSGDEYPVEGDLYLHVFRSINYAAGRYGPNLVSAIAGDNLHPEGGINIKSLRPLTSWRIRSAGGEKLRLEIDENRKEDVKRYKHDVVIKKKART